DVRRSRHAHDARRKDEFALAFVGAEKERPVLDDRAAKRAAEVIIPKFILPRLEEVPRVKIIVTQKIVSRSVKLVRARLDGDVYDRARIAPVFRRALRLNAEFGEGVDGEERRGRPGHAALIERRLVAERVVVVHAINQKDVRL